MTEDKESEALIRDWAENKEVEVLGMIPRDRAILQCERKGETPFESLGTSTPAMQEIRDIFRKIKHYYVSAE